MTVPSTIQLCWRSSCQHSNLLGWKNNWSLYSNIALYNFSVWEMLYLVEISRISLQVASCWEGHKIQTIQTWNQIQAGSRFIALGSPVKTLKQGCYEVRPPWTLAPGQRVEKASEGGICWRPGKMRSLWRNLVCLAFSKRAKFNFQMCVCVCVCVWSLHGGIPGSERALWPQRPGMRDHFNFKLDFQSQSWWILEFILSETVWKRILYFRASNACQS